MIPLHRAVSAAAASALISAALALPARSYDLQSRQNGTSFSAVELRGIFINALPAAYDQNFPDQRWSTDLLLDAHAEKDLVAHLLLSAPTGSNGASTLGGRSVNQPGLNLVWP
jgi:hypothetical protein